MEEEIYRNFALSLVNGNVGHRVPVGENHISDVVSDNCYLSFTGLNANCLWAT